MLVVVSEGRSSRFKGWFYFPKRKEVNTSAFMGVMESIGGSFHLEVVTTMIIFV